MTGRNVDLILGMKMNDFLEANKRAYVEYSKTKSQIERNPVNLKTKGGGDFENMGYQISRVGNAFQSLGMEAKPVFELLTQGNLSTGNLAKGFAGLSDMGLRAFQMVSILRIGVNGLMASIGPVGWVLLGLTAVTTAFSLFSSGADDAKDSASGLSKELNRPDFLPTWMDPEKMAASFGMKYLVKQQKIALSEMTEAAEKSNLTDYNQAKNYYDKITGLLKNYTEMGIKAHGGLTDKEIEELNKAKDAEIKKLDDLRAYEFQTNRISLFEYIQYLKAREEAIIAHYGRLSIEYLKHKDDIAAKEEELLQQQSNNQERLTDDTSKWQNARAKEVQKFIKTTTATTTTGIKEEYTFIKNLSTGLDNILHQALVGQFQSGISAVKSFGEAFMAMINQIAALLATKTIIWTFLTLTGLGEVGSLFSFLGFSKGGQVEGKAEGGHISRSDIARSAFTPSGEDGLIGVQIGETVINRRATQMFAPILDKINDLGRRNYGYASGGQVNEGGVLKIGSVNNLDDLVNAINNIQIVINTQLDAIQFYRETYPKYEKIKNVNRII